MLWLDNLIQKVCSEKIDQKDDKLSKCIDKLSINDNNDLAKIIVDRYTNLELKRLEIEIEKRKSCNTMITQIVKYIAIVIITSIFVYNKDTIVDIIQASKTSTTITTILDCNKTIDSNDTTNHKSTTDCNQTYSKRSDVK